MQEHATSAPDLWCRCGARLEILPDAATCRSCGASSAIDDAGVVHLTDRDVTWTHLPTRVVEDVRRATTAEQLVDAMVDDDRPWPREVQRRLLHPSGGAPAILVPAQPGMAALDLGTGWSMLSPALASFGPRVTTADWVSTRLRFGQLMHDDASELAVHLDPAAALPWPDGSFDAVFVDLDEVARATFVRDEADAQAGESDGVGSVLTEVRRVLAADGIAVIGTSRALRSRRADRPRAGRLARPGSPRRRWSFLWPWGSGLLTRAGFTDTRVIVPLPRRHPWRWLVPAEGLRDHLETMPHASALKARLKWLLIAVGGRLWLGAEYYVLARGTPSKGTPRTLAESLPELDGEPVAIRALSDARLAVAGTDTFVKLPLSSDQQEKLECEVQKLELARGTALRPFVVPWSRSARWHSVPYAVYPRIVHRPTTAAAAQAAIAEAIEAVPPDEIAPLDCTAFWQRLTSPRGHRDTDEVGARPLHDLVRERDGSALVPVGPTHGDLHGGNVLLPRDGHPVLVDWNRFELRNPLLLDAAFATVQSQVELHHATPGEAFLAFVDGDITGPLADRAHELMGDLDPLHTAVVVLLDRIVSYSRPRRRHKPWTMPAFEDAVTRLGSRLDAR